MKTKHTTFWKNPNPEIRTPKEIRTPNAEFAFETSTRHSDFGFPAVLFCLLTSALCPPAFAQGTAFTYQGKLNDGANPASGIYDLRFTIYDSTNNPGVVIAGPLTNSAVGVSNGLFTVALDFGGSAFNGAARWLEIAARTNGASVFTTLSPRQPLTPSPYAIFARNVGSNGLAAGTYSNAVTFNNAANSFSGTFAGNGSGLTNLNAVTLSGLSSAAFWRTNGNSGTTPGVSFIGTTDNQPLELRVNNARAMRIEPGGTNAPNVISGHFANSVSANVVGAVIGGGGGGGISPFTALPFTNRVTDVYGVVGGGLGNVAGDGDNNLTNAQYATVGGGLFNISSSNASTVAGGEYNQSSADHATVGGGQYNTSSSPFATVGGGFLNDSGGGSYTTVAGGDENTSIGDHATVCGGFANLCTGDFAMIGGGSFNVSSGTLTVVGGGDENTASGPRATIAGGTLNVCSGSDATIGGGSQNTNTGLYATIPGGFHNSATGGYSFAAGSHAKATNEGCFVWADSQPTDFASTVNNQFLIRAIGGVGIGNNDPRAPLNVSGGGDASLAGGGNIMSGLSTGLNIVIDNNEIMARNNSLASDLTLNAPGGNVGIGRTPTANALEVAGNASKTAAGSWLANSDARIKTDVQTLTNALDTLARVRLVKFRYTDEYRATHRGIEDHAYLNVVAQEFQKVFPEDVKRSGEKLANGDDILQVDTYPLTIYSAAAIQELNQKLSEELKQKETEITELKHRLDILEQTIGH